MRSAPRLLIVAAAGLALAAGTGTPAQAASYETTVDRYTDDGDDGGSSGSIDLHEPDNYENTYYSAQFWAKGEDFHLWDFVTDGREAQAVVIVYHPRTGEQLDVDRFKVSPDRHYKLGTPDGSGNIPEGYKVTVRLKAEGLDWAPGILRVTA
ncbi:hypothetical protein G5C51_18665 [Streptomyces sp. A7024]|uniref:Secreted protein n=1 Tax=Streptomyces coryli TaxID=1128680 RepID=A0A6G4U2D2_9ACTN|nr:hypothetical protein [Streptomyces coryli]NGN65910.1 hypothetical protein [Streptomyces coryli]